MWRNKRDAYFRELQKQQTNKLDTHFKRTENENPRQPWRTA